MLIFLLITENDGPQFPSIVAFESSSLKMMFDFSKPPGGPQTTSIKATFINLSANIYTDFIFQAAVPKVTSMWKLYLSALPCLRRAFRI